MNMDNIQESFTTKVTKQCDVLVAGGGVSGIAAALSAKRNGCKVILLEREYILGGLATAGLVTIYLPLCDGNGNQVTFGIAEELLKLSVCEWVEDRHPDPWLDGGSIEEKMKKRYEVQFNPHMFALLCEKLLIDSGVEILYGTSAVAVTKNNDKIETVITENKSGRSAIYVNKSVIDCTGDADICKLAGAKTEIFSQGNITASWHYFISDGTLNLRMKGFSDTPDKYKDHAKKEEENKRYTGIDGEELSKFVLDSHKQLLDDILEMHKNNSSHIPVTIATIPQIRMTRRIVGAYTMDDTEVNCDFADSVGCFGDWRKRGPVYKLPFSILYGNEVKNLITAGRCISVSDAMWDITRVIPVCALTGEAAGTAASISDDFATTDIAELKSLLRKNGVRF